jgi:hypothetical protein
MVRYAEVKGYVFPRLGEATIFSLQETNDSPEVYYISFKGDKEEDYQTIGKEISSIPEAVSKLEGFVTAKVSDKELYPSIDTSEDGWINTFKFNCVQRRHL